MAGSSSGAGAMRAVTISREYGSGGGEVAARLARRLRWHLVDHEIVELVARRLGVSEAEAEARDEHATGLAERLLRGIQWAGPVDAYGMAFSPETDPSGYQAALEQVIAAAVEAGPAVIVGRGAQVVLQARRDVLHVRVVAPLESRIVYVARREGLSDDAAHDRIRHKDGDRAHYLQETYHRSPADPHLYDLVLNTGMLGIDDAVDLIALALARKDGRLGFSADELRPGAGLPRYAGQPGDFQPQAGTR